MTLDARPFLLGFAFLILVWLWWDAARDYHAGVVRIRRGGRSVRLAEVLHPFEFERSSNPFAFWCLTAVRGIILLLLTFSLVVWQVLR